MRAVVICLLSASVAEDPEEKGNPRGGGKPTNISQEDFAARPGTAKQEYLNRMWNPKVQVRNGIAAVWAEYDFHLDGKFHHCGIDSFSMVKMPEGCKMACIVYSVETTGCAPSPLDARFCEGHSDINNIRTLFSYIVVRCVLSY